MSVLGERQALAAESARRDGRRRMIIGIAGLALMLLLVTLASILTNAARREAALAKAQAAAAGVTNPGGQNSSGAEGGPLADLGVTPSVGSDAPSASAVPSATTPQPRVQDGQVRVPDLQPDPAIDTPKR